MGSCGGKCASRPPRSRAANGSPTRSATQPWHLLNAWRPILPRSFRQEAELATQNGAAAHRRYSHAGLRQNFLRTAYQTGCALQAKGQHQEAAQSFAAAVDAAPDFADALQNLGFSLFALGQFEDAAKAGTKLVHLRPTDAGAQFNLGMALLSGATPADAVDALTQATRLDGSQAKHHHALGRALVAADRKQDAVAALMRASDLSPSDTALLVTIASLLIDLGQLNAAAGAAALAVRQQPGNAHAHGNLARALQGMGDSQAALAPARAATRLLPLNGGAAATLGAVLYTLGHHAEALERCQHASMLAPTLYQAKMNEALALEALGRLAEAETAARAALRLAPDAADMRHNLAAMLLASGRMTAETWELYDSRLRLHAASRPLAARPRWQGEDIAGKTVLLHSEQGFGDTIQFLRYAPMVAARGARVIVVVQPELFRLLRGFPGVDAVLPANGPLPDHDVFCPLLSLPRAFGTTLETIPCGGPYITADPDLVRQWEPPAAPGQKIGIVWTGSAVFVHNAARSIPTDALAPLADLPGVTFHSLQKPSQPAGALPVMDRMADASDFADTAAIIAGLDLVISVDSAVAHLAAAMGKEVWLLSRFVGCWRWLRNREDSPWYPTMRIFGQSAPGDWAGVIARVGEALAQRTGAPARQPPPAPTAEIAMPMPFLPAAKPVPRPGRPAKPSALDGLQLPAGAPRTVVALVGENENGILRSVSQDFMSLLPPHGLDTQVITMAGPHWLPRLVELLDQGVLFAWAPAGAGCRLPHPDGLMWDVIRTPFISVLADSPAWMPGNHHVPSQYVANGYMYRDWLDMQRRLIRSPQVSALLPHGVAANPARDATPWSQRRHRMVFVKTGCDPERHRAAWAGQPPRYRAILEDSAAVALRSGVGDISGIVLECMAQHGLYLEGRPDILFGLMRAVDVYVRDCRSTAMVRALLDLPVDIIGAGWEHLADQARRARFQAGVDAAVLPGLYADTQFLLNTMPNFAHGTHERVVNGFAAKCCVVTNENADMAARFGNLPSYVGVDTDAPDLADHMASLVHGDTRYDDRVGPAADLATQDYSAEGFMRGLVDLALEIRSAAMFAQFRY